MFALPRGELVVVTSYVPKSLPIGARERWGRAP